jgi:uncharacterized protein (TIGR04255 family)
MSKLPNAPLQEVIFEIRWPLQPDSTGKFLTDPEFPFVLGKFDALMKDKFPYRLKKHSIPLPSSLFNYQTLYQFWEAGQTWPVVQIGPGIATVNDTDKKYDWEKNFLPNIHFTLQALEKSYGSIDYSNVSLRYIDVVRVADYGFKDWQSFVHNNINFSFENHFDTPCELREFNFQQSFETNNTGRITVTFSTGKKKRNEDTFVWQTNIAHSEHLNREKVLSWLKLAHIEVSNLFKKICKDHFYASFK